jgi:hypothetical protein
MTKTKPNQQGLKNQGTTAPHAGRKAGFAARRQRGRNSAADDEGRTAPAMDRSKRQSEFPVSHGGMHQDSQHNKHRTD